MHQFVKAGAIAAAAVLGMALAGAAAQAAVITFETAPPGAFTGPVTESGFTYSRLSGGLYVLSFGNPGQEMEGQENRGGGVLNIVSAGTTADFTFSGLDYAAFNASGTGSQTLTVTGLLGGSTVGTDTYTLANTFVFYPKYANWTTELASNLAGKTIDDLRIVLNAGLAPHPFVQAIDNVVLGTPARVPEPASLVLLGGGLIGLGLLRRRRAG